MPGAGGGCGKGRTLGACVGEAVDEAAGSVTGGRGTMDGAGGCCEGAVETADCADCEALVAAAVAGGGCGPAWESGGIWARCACVAAEVAETSGHCVVSRELGTALAGWTSAVRPSRGSVGPSSLTLLFWESCLPVNRLAKLFAWQYHPCVAMHCGSQHRTCSTEWALFRTRAGSPPFTLTVIKF